MSVPTAMTKDAAYYRQDARNSVWAMAFVAFIPTFVVSFSLASGEGRWLRWNALTIGLLAYSLALSVLAIVAGTLCGMGRKIGRSLAFIPCILLLVNVPFGTLVAIFVLTKLNGREFRAALETMPPPLP